MPLPELFPNTNTMAIRGEQSPWNARDAWRYLFCLLVVELCLFIVMVLLVRAVPSLFRLIHRPEGVFIIVSSEGLSALAIMLWQTHTSSVAAFIALLERFGLLVSPGKLGIAGVLLGIALGTLGSYLASLGMAPHNPITEGLVTAQPVERLWLTALILFVPFVEEVIVRGFLYRAFRNSYSFSVTTILVLLLAGVGHWGVVSKSLTGFGLIMALNAVLCYTREKGQSLWDCVIGHLAYNATLHLLGTIGRS